MPVRRLDQTVFKWPDKNAVHKAAVEWAAHLSRAHPEVRSIGYFGSYARGNWGVGSDLDVVIVLGESHLPFERRSLEFDLPELPVPVDLLVYTDEEWDRLATRGMRRPAAEMVWILNR